MRIAITGGIGSGKSFVCRLLEKRGIEVFNCDIVAKQIIATHHEVRDELYALVAAENAAAESADTEGAASENAASKGAARATVSLGSAEGQATLTKQALGDYIRRGPEFAARVNAIVHPRVAGAFLTSGLQWMECAILFESGFDRLVDRVVVVTCPTEERIRRIMDRDHCDADTAHRWLALQMTDEERLDRAADKRPFHIVNDGISPIAPQLDALLATLAL